MNTIEIQGNEVACDQIAMVGKPVVDLNYEYFIVTLKTGDKIEVPFARGNDILVEYRDTVISAMKFANQ